MDLDDFKMIMEQQDKLIRQHAGMTEELVKTIKKDKIARLLGGIALWEYVNLSVCLLLICLLIIWQPSPFDAYLGACYVFAMCYLVCASFLGYSKIVALRQIDAGSLTLIEAARKTEQLHLRIARMKLADILSFPFIIVAMFGLVHNSGYGINVFEKPEQYLLRILLACVLGICAAIVVYQKVYQKRLVQAKQKLDELNKWMEE